MAPDQPAEPVSPATPPTPAASTPPPSPPPPPRPGTGPQADDYLRLFARWHAMLREDLGEQAGRDMGDLYKAPDDERYRLLYEQVCQLLVRASPFNAAMPAEFGRTARQWLAGDAATLAHMGQASNRHFMLSDLYDYVHLARHMGVGWR